MATDEPIDVVLIGGGIMSATLGTLLHALQPDWTIRIYERLGAVAQESSNPWNNAGTGHAALCELNYTPERADGTIDIASAVKVNEQFQLSREFWSSLVPSTSLPSGTGFINSTPHMTFVRGAENVDFLRRRWEALTDQPAVRRDGVLRGPGGHLRVGPAAHARPRQGRADRGDAHGAGHRRRLRRAHAGAHRRAHRRTARSCC